MVVYSESVSRLRPATYTLVFIGFDFISLLLQAAGGGIAASANTQNLDNIGKNIMVAGVSWQVLSLALFAALCIDFALRVRRASQVEMNPAFASFRKSRKFKAFLFGLAAATFTIFVRSVYRCAELSGGFHGKLANQEITFMILEGADICIAVICLTVFHPGVDLRAGVAGGRVEGQRQQRRRGDNLGKLCRCTEFPWRGRSGTACYVV